MISILERASESTFASQITPIDYGNKLDDRFLQTIKKDVNGRQTIVKGWPLYGKPITPNKKPKIGKYTLRQVTSLKDIFTKPHSKL